jgi:ATP-binding protein involved in chromosome partitioning
MPEEIVGLLRPTITFTWADGHVSVFPPRTVRLMCRCAECIEETSGKPLLDPGAVPDSIRAKGIALVGQYGISIDWTVKPCANIYNFRDLRASCPCEACAALRASGVKPA